MISNGVEGFTKVGVTARGPLELHPNMTLQNRACPLFLLRLWRAAHHADRLIEHNFESLLCQRGAFQVPSGLDILCQLLALRGADRRQAFFLQVQRNGETDAFMWAAPSGEKRNGQMKVNKLQMWRIMCNLTHKIGLVQPRSL